MDYTSATVQIKKGKTFKRSSWPDNQYVYHDLDNDKVPDLLPAYDAGFIKSIQIQHQAYLNNLYMHDDGETRKWEATQADYTATDWVELTTE